MARPVLKVAVHLLLVFVSFIAAYELRRGLPLSWWLSGDSRNTVLIWSLAYTAVAALVEAVFQTERASWRFAATADLLRILRSASATTAIFLVASFLVTRAYALPRSSIVLTWILSILALTSVRVGSKLFHDRSLLFTLLPGRARKGETLYLVGDIEDVELFLRRGRSQSTYDPVGIVVPRSGGKGQLVHGVPVLFGFANVVDDLLAMAGEPSAAGSVLFFEGAIGELNLKPRDIGRLKGGGFKLLREARPVEMGGEDSAVPLRELRLEDFLRRAVVDLDPGPVLELVRGRRVLVTGAGGSIGSEIARQLANLGCARLVLLDQSELNLFNIERELGPVLASDGVSRAVLADVRDAARLGHIFTEERPEIVFHAAALKHVSMVEGNVGEAVLTNVVGTWNVARAAQQSGALNLVLVSSDKAVDPSSFMGATKRLAEAVLYAFGGGGLSLKVVRFGNVLGSSGSVLPLFAEQIERGGPITITDPDVERYFMTIPEAVQLVLQASALGGAGETGPLRKFVLDMGSPVRIVDLAHQMIELCGLQPGQDIDIIFTGLKPGEKLKESLVDIREVAVPCVPGISEITTSICGHELGGADVERLAAAARTGDPRGVGSLVRHLLAVARLGEAAAKADPDQTAPASGPGGLAGATPLPASPAALSLK